MRPVISKSPDSAVLAVVKVTSNPSSGFAATPFKFASAVKVQVSGEICATSSTRPDPVTLMLRPRTPSVVVGAGVDVGVAVALGAREPSRTASTITIDRRITPHITTTDMGMSKFGLRSLFHMPYNTTCAEMKRRSLLRLDVPWNTTKTSGTRANCPPVRSSSEHLPE